MKIIVSPTKSLDFETTSPTSLHSQPQFLAHSETLQKKLKTLSANQLGALMKISPALSSLNYQRNQAWNTPFTPQNSKQAVYSFTGEVFRGIDAKTIKKENIPVLQERLRIISGLYGLLKPLDLIQPYRLEMGTRLPIGKANNLYDFWGNTIAESLNEELTDDALFVNLASSEYFKAVPKKELKAPMITPVFKEFKNGTYKIIMTYAKKARGLMVRYLIDHNVTSINGLKSFDGEGYAYDENMSSENELVFTR